MIELDPVVADPRPAELRLIQPLGIKTHAAAVPPDDLDPVRSFGAEYIKCAVERLCGAPHN
ncbi:hypothetical protein NKH60_34605, partial [Mesorhizobium sp. M1006]